MKRTQELVDSLKKKVGKKLETEEDSQLDDYLKYIKNEPLSCDFDLDVRPDRKTCDASSLPKAPIVIKVKKNVQLPHDCITISDDDNDDRERPSDSLASVMTLAGLKELVQTAEDTEWTDLGNEKKVKSYKSPLTGQTLIDLKKFDCEKVTDTGITLDEAQIKILYGLLPALEMAYETVLHTEENVKISEAIGRNVFVNLNSKVLCVDLRKFFTPRGKTESFPSKKTGIGTRFICNYKPIDIDYNHTYNT